LNTRPGLVCVMAVMNIDVWNSFIKSHLLHAQQCGS